ncbi:MAG: hypothetical protein GXP45_05505 [bacterium]|nr:hypothetical protein [bacterium]
MLIQGYNPYKSPTAIQKNNNIIPFDYKKSKSENPDKDFLFPEFFVPSKHP